MKAGFPPSAGRSARTRWAPGLSLLAVILVFLAQYSFVRATNFGGVDEWLYIDLGSRGILAIPYANRPFVLLWTTIASQVWADDLRSYWLFHGLYLALAACLTTVLTRRVFPGCPRLAILAGVFAAAWAPQDPLRLDTVVGTGYSGFTLAAMLALTLFVESWRRARADLLALGALVGMVAARGVESVIPVLAVAPILAWGTARAERCRLARWSLLWYGVVGLELALALRPLISGTPSYQGEALGLDLHPLRVLERLAGLLAMQAGPLVTSSPTELLAPAVPLAVVAFLLFTVLATRFEPPGVPVGSRRAAVRAGAVGLLLACAAHAGLALSVAVKTASRTQILSAPGFGLALAGAVVLVGSLLPGRWARAGTLVLGAWVVAVGTGRTLAVQKEWEEFRGLYPEQQQTLVELVDLAPAVQPGTLFVLLDETDTWNVSLTFRHAVAYLYPGQALGLVPHAPDFLYPWSFTHDGIAIWPWRQIQTAWGQAPSLHPWETLVVIRRSGPGRLEILPRWPGAALVPLPAGARYAPRERLLEGEPRPRSRRILGVEAREEIEAHRPSAYDPTGRAD